MASETDNPFDAPSAEADTPLYRLQTKAVISDGGPLKYGSHWVMSRRGFLTVYADRLECGDWRIPLGSIDDAALVRLRGFLGLLPAGYVLRIRASENHYDFGLNPWALRGVELPFEVRDSDEQMQSPWWRTAIRGFALAYLLAIVLYWLFR